MHGMKAHDLLTATEERSLADRIVALRVAYWRALLSHAPFVDHLAAWVRDHLAETEMSDVGVDLCAQVITAGQAVRAMNRLAARQELVVAVDALAQHMALADPESVLAHQITAELRGLLERRRGTIPWPHHRIATPLVDYVSKVILASAALNTARNRFAASNLRLVVRMANRCPGSGMPFADLIQEGNIGLLKAVDRFEPTRGFRFSTYASWWIKHAMRRAIANRGRLVRLPQHVYTLEQKASKVRQVFVVKYGREPTTAEVAQELGIPMPKLATHDATMSSPTPLSLDAKSDHDLAILDHLVADEPDPADLLDVGRLEQQMRAALEALSPIEQDILRLRYGLDGAKRLTLAEVGKQHGLSRERIRQLQERALERLREHMGAT